MKMLYKNYCGIDVSKAKLDIALISEEGEITFYKCKNSQDSISEFIGKILKKHNLNSSETLFIAEHTGHYSNPLTYSMLELKYNFWIESGAQIAACQGVTRGKSDKIDAERIAMYGKRFSDEAKLLKPKSESIVELEFLLSERDFHTKILASYKVQMSDHKDFTPDYIFDNKECRLKKIMNELKKVIQEIEIRIDEIIKSEEELSQKIELMTSITGIGRQIANNIIIATEGFKKFTDPRKFACHIGIAPFRYTSGSSIHSAHRVSKKANLKLKSLIHMGTLSAIRIEGDLRNYYLRKVEEGKNKMSALNAVRNKLIHRIFAVVKSGIPYHKNFINEYQKEKITATTLSKCG